MKMQTATFAQHSYMLLHGFLSIVDASLWQSTIVWDRCSKAMGVESSAISFTWIA